MGRAKLNMKLIENEKTRNFTFQKRKNNVKKKIYELSTLCGVEVGLVIYGPTINNNDLLELEIWPAKCDNEILQLINKYKAQSPEARKKRTFHLSDYFVDRKKKTQNELAKLRKINDQAQYPTWDHRYNGLSVDQLKKISSMLEMKLNDAKIRHYNYVYFIQQQELWQQQQQQCLFNNFLNTINSQEPCEQPYNYQLQQGISIFDHHTYLSPINQLKPFDQPYNYQLQQEFSTFDHRTNLISNSRIIESINDTDYVEGASNCKNIVYGPTLKAEPGVYDEPIKAGMVDNIGIVKNLIRAPQMSYYGEAMLSMPHEYNMEYPMWVAGGATTDQLRDFSQTDGHKYYKNRDYDVKKRE